MRQEGSDMGRHSSATSKEELIRLGFERDAVESAITNMRYSEPFTVAAK